MSTGEVACPLCGSNRVAPLFTKRQTAYWACAACTFRFATPDVNPNLTQTLDGYEDAYLQYLAPDVSDRVNFEVLYRWMAGFATLEGARLLDVGAGSGKLVRFLRGRGIDARGIEPSRALFDRFLEGQAEFTSVTLDELQASAPQTFDIVTAFDVIEHVPDPTGFLRAVSTCLEPDGIFFASTPDVESLTARLFGRRWHFYHSYHLSYLGPRTIARAAAPNGLRMLDHRHRGRLRSTAYMIRYAAETIGGIEAPRWARWFDGWYLPVNLFDTMYVVFRREPEHPR
jgi:2-polyprenyl-3-methyl-5-hydroxy-6-metoxy-1,4-benzoquinol methylase